MAFKKFPIVVNVPVGLNTIKDGITYVNFGVKDQSKYQLPQKNFVVNSAVIASTGGSASINEVTFAGTYAIGDQIRLTLTIKDSAQTLVKNYVHTVTAIAVGSIAGAFEALIDASILNGLPGVASASAAAGVLTITSSSLVSNNFQVTAYTASAAGTVSPSFSGGSAQAVTQAEGVPAVLKEAGVPAADITLATYDTVLLTYKQDAAIPFIDSEGKVVKDVKVFVPTGQGAALIARF
jgi:hypothetical protein